MIFQTLANLIYNIITKLLNFVDIPPFPGEIPQEFFDYIGYGTGIFCYLVPISAIKVLLPVLVVIMSSEYVYYFIMWILKKIPMAGIE